MVRKSKKFKFTRKLALISLAAVIVIAGGGLGFWHYHNRSNQTVITSTPGKSTAALPGLTNQSASGAASNSDKQTPSSGGYSASNNQNPTSTVGQAPLAPTGTFVSNHRPGNPYPTTEQSVCNTTPGASCYIKFTNESTVKTLAAQLTDSNGTTIWNWDAKDFPSGNWQIEAVATLNGQTATATDGQNLVAQ